MNRKPPAAGKGRPKGSKNKTTVAFKEAVMHAAEGLGGADRLMAWAGESPDNERVFWAQIYTKLAPLTVGGDPDAPIVFRTIYEQKPGT